MMKDTMSEVRAAHGGASLRGRDKTKEFSKGQGATQRSAAFRFFITNYYQMKRHNKEN